MYIYIRHRARKTHRACLRPCQILLAFEEGKSIGLPLGNTIGIGIDYETGNEIGEAIGNASDNAI